MVRLAGELEMGRSLDNILRNNPRFLPPHMQRLIETGVQSGNLPEVLVQLIEIDRSAADLRRSVRLAVAYPIMLIVLWMILVALFAGYVLPDLLHVFDDFKMNLPLPTKALKWVAGKWMLRVVGFLAAAIPMIIVSARIVRRPLGWQRLLTDIPLIGPTLLWRGVANWSQLLALLLRQHIPLPEALRLASSGVGAPIMTVAGLRRPIGGSGTQTCRRAGCGSQRAGIIDSAGSLGRTARRFARGTADGGRHVRAPCSTAGGIAAIGVAAIGVCLCRFGHVVVSERHLAAHAVATAVVYKLGLQVGSAVDGRF